MGLPKRNEKFTQGKQEPCPHPVSHKPRSSICVACKNILQLGVINGPNKLIWRVDQV